MKYMLDVDRICTFPRVILILFFVAAKPNLNRDASESVFWVSDQIWHKSACTAFGFAYAICRLLFSDAADHIFLADNPDFVWRQK